MATWVMKYGRAVKIKEPSKKYVLAMEKAIREARHTAAQDQYLKDLDTIMSFRSRSAVPNK